MLTNNGNDGVMFRFRKMALESFLLIYWMGQELPARRAVSVLQESREELIRTVKVRKATAEVGEKKPHSRVCNIEGL